MTAGPRIPSRSIWNPDAIDDGSRRMVDLDTGEIIDVPPSRQRARRLADRVARKTNAAPNRPSGTPAESRQHAPHSPNESRSD